ncbi:F-box protein CPR1-like [Mercurialis annua]|uniref:F-box protein CPR1-like n=1 Tax=Mercurialis annua TaxID=3986 RepID=UPI00215FDCC8|nr:F-box protein CPR1-like [Mercurialis annua]
MSELSFDILCDVLKLLPVKSLLRFRCLSKELCSLIDSPDFINLHLSQSNHTNTNRSLVAFQPHIWPNMSTYMIDLDFLDYQRMECDLFSENSIITYYYDHSKNLAIFGSCNGLIALYHPNQGMLLWNPSTKKQRKLPDFWVGHEVCDPDYILDGFGYDCISDDYKVVRIRIGHKRSRVMVYSVKRNSCRVIEEFPYNFIHSGSKRRCGTLVGSCLHWIVSKSGYSADPRIVAFNLEDERYQTVPIPDLKTASGANYMLQQIGVVGGCLSMSMHADENGFLEEIWVMKEYGIRESCARIFSVFRPDSGFENYMRPFVKSIEYSKFGDKVSLNVHGYRFWVYELQDEEQTSHSQVNQPPYVPEKRLERLKIETLELTTSCDNSFICVRSLVPVNFDAQQS